MFQEVLNSFVGPDQGYLHHGIHKDIAGGPLTIADALQEKYKPGHYDTPPTCFWVLNQQRRGWDTLSGTGVAVSSCRNWLPQHLIKVMYSKPPRKVAAKAVARAVASKVMADTCGATQAPLPPLLSSSSPAVNNLTFLLFPVLRFNQYCWKSSIMNYLWLKLPW